MEFLGLAHIDQIIGHHFQRLGRQAGHVVLLGGLQVLQAIGRREHFAERVTAQREQILDLQRAGRGEHATYVVVGDGRVAHVTVLDDGLEYGRVDVQAERIVDGHEIGGVVVDVGFVQAIVKVVAGAGHHQLVHGKSGIERGEHIDGMYAARGKFICVAFARDLLSRKIHSGWKAWWCVCVCV